MKRPTRAGARSAPFPRIRDKMKGLRKQLQHRDWYMILPMAAIAVGVLSLLLASVLL